MVRFAKHNVGRKAAAVAVVLAMGALLVGCGPSTYLGASSSAAPVSFACESSQRAVMRQVLVNGVPQQQMSCESTNGASEFAPVGTTGTVPAAVPGYAPGSYVQAPLADTQFVPATQVVTRQIAPTRVVYQQVPERRIIVRRPKRSVRTSALIIGGSAAGGAGIGALIGGKRGAGIGALAGGGAAALWDQITRHR